LWASAFWSGDVAGYVSLDDAILACVNAGLIVVQPIQWQFDPAVPYGYVISQSPASGSGVPYGTPVHLVVSKGPAPSASTIGVPNLANLMYLDAQRLLTSNGLLAVNPVWAHNNSVRQTYVISQSVAAGSLVAPNTQVVLTVSIGPSISWPQDGTLTVPLVH
jgi:serine/threonine-protein kinase